MPNVRSKWEQFIPLPAVERRDLGVCFKSKTLASFFNEIVGEGRHLRLVERT